MDHMHPELIQCLIQISSCDHVLVVGIAGRVLVQLEEVTEFAQTEVPLHILFLVHHTTAQGLLVGLALEDLLFNSSCLGKVRRIKVSRSSNDGTPNH